MKASISTSPASASATFSIRPTWMLLKSTGAPTASEPPVGARSRMRRPGWSAGVSGAVSRPSKSRALGPALVARLWDDQRGQFHQGALTAPDPTAALDCASWGATFLAVYGDAAKARRSLAAAQRYAARDRRTGATGYRPYLARPLIESRAAYEYHKAALPPGNWDQLEAVWPEGTAGVALAQLRQGDAAGARRTLAGMDPLRDAAGGLPGLTLAIPTEFTTSPALAGTVWETIVRSEADGRPGALRLWYE